MKKKINTFYLHGCIVTLFLMSFTFLGRAQTANRGNALDFDGNNDFVSIATGAGIVPTSGNYTVSFWAKHNSSQAGSYFELFSQGHFLYFGGDQGGNIRIGDSWPYTGVAYPADGGWHHFSIVRSGTTGYLYIDGILRATKSSGFQSPPVETFLMGIQYGYMDECFNGQLDEFSVWNRVLSVTEILSLMTTELGGSESGLVAYYNFNQGIAGGANSSIVSLIEKKGLYNGSLGNFTKTGSSSNFVNSGVATNQNALDLDGVNDNVFIASGAGVVPTSGDYTVSTWAKHNAAQLGVYYELFAQSGNLYLGGNTTGIIRVGDGWGNTGVPYPSDGGWHYFSVVRSGTTCYLYIDGALMATKTSFASPYAGTFVIGSQYSGNSEFFNGQFDEFSVWSRALSNLEIKSFMNSELSGTESGLVAYYNFNQGIIGGNNSFITHIVDKKGSKPGTLTNFTKTGSTSNFVGSGFVPGGMLLKLQSMWPTTGPIGTTVTISGSGFSSTPANNIVYFGAVTATVSASTANSITVTVPDGAGSIVAVSVQVGSKTSSSISSTTPYFDISSSSGSTLNFALNNSTLGANVPKTIIATDLNADGRPDIITGNTNNFSVKWGWTSGTVFGTSTFATGSGDVAVGVGDFNGDGKKDIAAANSSSNNVSILIGSGTGNFAAAVNYSVGVGPKAIAIGDFNEDGKADIATINYTSNNISILIGNGSGLFSAATYYATGTNPCSIAVGDFNGDGKEDLVVANRYSYNVSVFLGNGMGGFAAASNFSLGEIPYAIAVCDFNKDGKMDIATANYSSPKVGVYFGNGMGGFAASVLCNLTDYPETLAIGDFNGDGNADIVASSPSNNAISIVYGHGDGSFTVGSNYSVGTYPYSIAVLDFNKDGFADIATANVGSSDVSILLQLLPAPLGGSAASNSPICQGATASILLSGHTGNIQWQQSGDGSTNWVNVTGGSGANAAHYTTANLASSMFYRAQVSQTGYTAVYSNIVQIMFYPNTLINSQYTSSQSQPLNGNFLAISVSASGGSLTFQWYSNSTESNSGGSSLDWANGGQTDTYTPQAVTAGTLYYYCIVSGCGIDATSAISGAFNVVPCQEPSSLSAINITGNSAELNWSCPGETQWNIKYGTGSFNPLNSGLLISGIVPPYTLNGLSPTTNYNYYVQTDCGAGSVSIWAGPFSFTTDCGIISTLWTEDFEAAAFPPFCWSSISESGGGYWERNTSCSSNGIGAAAIKANFYSQSNSTSYSLITFPFDISSYTISKLKFDYAYAPFPGYENDRMNVYYSSDFGQSWNLLILMTGGGNGTLNTAGPITSVFIPTSSQWATQSINLPAGSNKIKFEAISGFGNNLYLDNIRLENYYAGIAASNSPICNGATASLTLSSYSGTIQWQESADGLTNWIDVTAGSGANTNNYIRENMTSTQYYCAKVNNAGDSAYSNVVQIIIHPNTTIDSQSTFSQTQPYNGSFSPISVTASGAWSYQWYINTFQSLSGGTSLGSANGAQTNTYTPQANYDGERYYYCIVQGCQPNVTSQISDFFRVICPTPDNAAASNITSNSAVLSWNANGGTQWSIKYALGYFDPQTSGTIVTGVTNPFTLTGLAGGNSYYYYVQTNCGSNASTNWSGPYYFNTECGITSGAWSENFELGMLPPLCWYNYFFLEAMWFPTNACSSYGIGTTSIFANFFNQEYGASYYLSTFAFDISTLNQPKLKFDYAYAAYPFPGYEDDRLNVYYTTDFGFNWNLLTVMTGGSGGTLNTAGASYGPFTPNLSQWATQSISLPTGTNRIKFEAISGMGNNLYLDNIRVSGTLPSVKTINLHLFLEGLYNASTLSMNAVQDGNSGSAQWAPVIADKIDVELYNENAPYTAAGVSISGIDISTNGLASFQTDTSKNGNYYIKVSNRNHLATWSAIAVPFNGDTVYYDFTTNLFQAYGSNPQVQVGFSPDLFAFYLGDLDQGGWIDSDDFNMFEPDLTLGATGFYGSDFNGGGWVDSDDFNMFEPRITAGNATEYPGK